MTTYLTIFFEWNTYQPNKDKIKEIRERYKFKWAEKKLKENILYSELIRIYKIFKSENKVIDDNNLKNRNGASGVWYNDNDMLKIVAFDSICDKESPPILMIYKGIEGEFYRELVKICIDIGCEIGVLNENLDGTLNTVFKKQKGIEEAERNKNDNDSKIGIKKRFDSRILELENVSIISSNKFVDLWCKCIEKYGVFTIKDLLNNSVEKEEDSNNGR